MSEIGRVLGSVVGLPLGAIGHAIHGWLTGARAVVIVDVEPIGTLLGRVRWLERVRRLGADPHVEGVVFRIQGSPGNWAAGHDLRQAIAAVRAANTRAYAFVEAPGNAALWLASACERVFVPPTSEVGLVGLGVEVTFFGALLERLGVKTDFESAGVYKSLAEPYTRTFPSAANHDALQTLVQALHGQLIHDVAAGRGLQDSDVESAMAEAPMPVERARELSLVDQEAYWDQVRTWVEQEHGDGVVLIEFDGWARRDFVLAQVETLGRANGTVAVVHLEGNIVLENRGSGDAIAARVLIPLLRGLTEDDSVAAVVLHVNSPGGSALASDLIWREVDQLRARKPVVACYEDVSASGGVYLSAPATEIVARPGTLTGSIGVVGGKLVVGEGMRKLGVHSQPIEAAPNASVFSASRPFTPPQRARFRASLERFYDAFVKRVADGRNRDPADLEPHCRGRVWTGSDAKERGIVDRIGGLELAVQRAGALAGLAEGTAAMRHLTGSPQSPMARLASAAMRRAAPGAGALTGLVEVGADMRAWMSLLAAHPGEPLVWMPWQVRLR
ncbi:MAG: protease-4 [Myxococcota bacterium]|jgi:protease-4